MYRKTPPQGVWKSRKKQKLRTGKGVRFGVPETDRIQWIKTRYVWEVSIQIFRHSLKTNLFNVAYDN